MQQPILEACNAHSLATQGIKRVFKADTLHPVDAAQAEGKTGAL